MSKFGWTAIFIGNVTGMVMAGVVFATTSVTKTPIERRYQAAATEFAVIEISVQELADIVKERFPELAELENLRISVPEVPEGQPQRVVFVGSTTTFRLLDPDKFNTLKEEMTRDDDEETSPVAPASAPVVPGGGGVSVAPEAK